MIANAVWIGHEECTVEVLQKIIAGICVSRLTPREFKKIFACPNI
jgi:hypothetical protein